MAATSLRYDERPNLSGPSLVLGLSGWMDGGEVSTGSIKYLVRKTSASAFAEIDPCEFYIYNVPGPMEISSLFRPHTVIEDGLVREFNEPKNTFYASESYNLILFSGREPNLKWRDYADCLFGVAAEFGVRRMCFVGSVSGLVPHTKAPLFYSTASSEELRALTGGLGLQPTNYEGPSSFGSYLIQRCKQYRLEMATVVAGIPAYVDGRNATGIEAAVGKVASLMEIDIETNDLKVESEAFIKGLNKIVAEKPDFREHVKKLEAAYEEQTPESKMDEDIREWFERQGMGSN